MITRLIFLSRNIHDRCLSDHSFTLLTIIKHIRKGHCLLHQDVLSGSLVKDAREVIYSNLVRVIQSFLMMNVVFIWELRFLGGGEHVLQSWQVLLIKRRCSTHYLRNVFNNNGFIDLYLLLSINLSFWLFLSFNVSLWRFFSNVLVLLGMWNLILW
jgi:hypothetical protein